MQSEDDQLIQARARLASLWIGDVFCADEAIVEYFNKEWKLSGAIALGYSDDKGRIPPRKSVAEVAEFLE